MHTPKLANALVLMFALHVPAHAQTAAIVSPGDSVRPVVTAPGTLIRLTTTDTLHGLLRTSTQTARINQMRGDSMLLSRASARPVGNGVVRPSAQVEIATSEHGHALIGGFVGGIIGALSSLGHRGGDDATCRAR